MDKVILPNGRPAFGIYNDAIAQMNAGDFDLRTPMGKRAGPLRRWVGYKQFEYFGVISPELLFGCAVANLRHAAVLFCYVYLPETGELQEFTFRRPFAWRVRNSQSPIVGTSSFGGLGVEVRFGYEDQPRRKTLQLSLPGKLTAELAFDETAAGFEPMSICSQIGRPGWVYAHKVAAVPVTGFIEGSFGRRDMAEIGAWAHHDYSAGYMRRETFWNWACLSGALPDGRSIGLNVSCGVNETSYSENCFWLAGKRYAAGLAQFDYDQDDPMQPWRVTAGDGVVDLTFTPEGLHVEKLNAWLIRSNFKQVFGRFAGEIVTPAGERLRIAEQYGFVEDQYAKW